jgi:hypothetical protein
LRAYSFEIECYYNNHSGLENVSNDISNAIGVSNDNSLNDDGKEFITPKLSGKKGAKLLKDTCKLLIDNGFFVNSTTGLHMHVDASDFKDDIHSLKNLFLFYMIFEPVIYSFLPYSRRSNTYCMPLEQFYNQKEIENCSEVEELEKIWYREQDYEQKESRKKNKYDQSRYAGVNFHSLFKDGHIEFRHHSGTLDYEKMNMWKELHLAIIDKCIVKETEYNRECQLHAFKITPCRNILELSLRRDKMFELLELEPCVQKYFLARNKKFSKELQDNNETLCAE